MKCLGLKVFCGKQKSDFWYVCCSALKFLYFTIIVIVGNVHQIRCYVEKSKDITQAYEMFVAHW